jgi:hypothetical protein
MGDENPEPVVRRKAPPPLSTRLGWLGVAFAVLYLSSVYAKFPAVRPGVTVGDLIDIATPVILLVLYALAGRGIGSAGAGSGALRLLPRLLIMLGGFALVMGHGMHVAANSIHDAIDQMRIQDPHGLVNWWDERVSHFAIDSSKVAICVGLTALEARASQTGEVGAGGVWDKGAPWIFPLGAMAYGFITFAAGIEGQTFALLLPFSVAYAIWSLRNAQPFQPVRRFYTLGALVSILLFTVWGVWHRGFPEFSAVGLIP